MSELIQQAEQLAGLPANVTPSTPPAADNALVKQFIGYMPRVVAYDRRLLNLRAWWEKVALTGKINSHRVAATLLGEMEATKERFDDLRGSLIESLVQENFRKQNQDLRARAQVAIDILIRNLFERTADVGFLATDDDLRNFLRAENVSHDAQAAMIDRLRAYTLKYSVYDDIVVLDTDGNVQVRLDQSSSLARKTNDPLIAETLTTPEPYVEVFRQTDLQPHKRRSLIYSARITDIDEPDSRVLGVLCLCFRFDDEMDGIFGNLCRDGQLLAILDDDDAVIATSNEQLLAYDATIPAVEDDGLQLTRRHAKRYVTCSAVTKGYQGYVGLPWKSRVMMPTDKAFSGQRDAQEGSERDQLSQASPLFSSALRSITSAADTVTEDLILVVLNGQIVAAKKDAKDFMPVLDEIRSIGKSTKKVFDNSISSLYDTVLSSLLDDLKFQAFLAVDIMDRNLYERANDVRWWALTSRFREILSKANPDEADRQVLGDVLRYINSLYTVYTNLFVYGRDGEVLAVSNPSEQHVVGTRLPMSGTFSDALHVNDHQRYVVSPFAKTGLYDDRPTYIYATGVRAPDGDDVVGGIGIVFDAEPEFEAMLADAAPRDSEGDFRSGSFGVFANRDGLVISSTNPDIAPGSRLQLDQRFFQLACGERNAELTGFNGQTYAVGAAMSQGYREYKTTGDYDNDIVGLMFVPV